MADACPALAVDLAAPPPATLAALFPVPVARRAARDRLRRRRASRRRGDRRAGHRLHRRRALRQRHGQGGRRRSPTAGSATSASIDGDAVHLLDWLPPASLTRVDLLYPDPWPKRRHWKRRFVSPGQPRPHRPRARPRRRCSASRATSTTTSPGRSSTCTRRDDFVWTAERADDWRKPFPGWPGTRYEAKAITAGRRSTYLAFRRV